MTGPLPQPTGLRGVAVTPSGRGGHVAIADGLQWSTWAPQGVGIAEDWYVSVGPLTLSVPDDGVVLFDRLDFEDPDGGLLGGLDRVWPSTLAAGAGAAGGAATADEDVTLTRRDLLKGVGAAGAMAMTARPAAADHDEWVLAEFSLAENTEGLRIGLADAYEGVMPRDGTYAVEIGERVDHFGGDEAATLPPEVTGDGRIAIDGHDSLQATARGLLDDPTIRARRMLPKRADAYQPWTTLVVDESPLAVEALARADRSVARIGTMPIPHIDEWANEAAGRYYVERSRSPPAIVVEIGEQAPDARAVTVEARVGLIEYNLDRVDRLRS